MIAFAGFDAKPAKEGKAPSSELFPRVAFHRWMECHSLLSEAERFQVSMRLSLERRKPLERANESKRRAISVSLNQFIFLT
jgi:hypothetical protein